MSFAINRRFAFCQTIGARLTLWGTAITLLACVLLCAILYFGLRLAVIREVDGFLEGEVYEFRSILTEEDEADEFPEVQREIRHELGSRLRGDLTFRLLDRTGRLLLSSDPQDPLPDPWAMPPVGEMESASACLATFRVPRLRSSFRVCSHWIALRGTPYVAQAAYLLNGMEDSLATFRHVCLAALLVVPVMALAGGYVLARRSLRPVETITRTARQIGAGQLSRRIARSGSGDELDRLAETLNDMLDRIEKHVHQMQQFTADASHELRTPLAALRGTAEVALSRSRSTEELRTVLEDSMEHYARLSRIADDLLLLARADVGQLPLARERICLNQAVADVVDLYTPLAQEQGIELKVVEGPEVWLYADGARIRQLLGNIIDNAVKYAGDGSHVRVALTTAKGRALLTVTDDGPGIAPQDLPHVFDRFYRADRSRSSRAAGGAGLGLPICRMIAELHGGDIHLDSSPDRGTSVTVSLPLVNAATGSSERSDSPR
jgi:heavy metal sensor kinase